MRKLHAFIWTLVFSIPAGATNYYIDAVNGSDALNSGQSSGSAYKTIKKAADLTLPGDTVFIMNGTYTTTSGTVVTINRSGDASGQIVYTNFPGHTPKLQGSAQTFAVISISAGTSYITINGLEISGNGINLSLAADTAAAKAQLVCPTTGSPATTQTPLQKYNGHGITADSRSVAIGSHHCVVKNNVIHDNCAAGVGFLKCDYITIENNRVYNNSWYTIYGTSGISFNQCYNYDNNTTDYKIIVRNNISYGNRMYVPFYNDCKVTDGNGIILDIPLADYNGRSLVANNICFNNGGSGIHTFSMNNVDIVHNVSYLNSASPEINSANIYGLQTNNVRIMNNIIVARPGKRMNAVNASTNLLYDYNIFFGGNSYELVGTHSIFQDPQFVNPSTDPAVADFRLQPTSLGINAGNNSLSYPTDYTGTPRPSAGTVDIGAYESSYSGTPSCSGNITPLVISSGNGNGTGEPSASLFYAPLETKPAVAGQKSRKGIVYPAALLTTIPANTAITSLKFRRAVQISSANTAPSTQTIPADNCGIRVYLRNEAADNLGAGSFDWNSILPGAANPAVLVYGGEAGTIVGNGGGWKEIPFQVPFTYTGSHLGVFIEYVQNGNITGGTDINWIYDNGGSQPLYNITNYPGQANGFKATTVSGNAAIGTALATSNERRPVITFNYCSSGQLPVKFLHLNAVKQAGGIAINWLVANEENNAGFEVQRSPDGIHFSTIGHVAGKAANGTSAVPVNYSYFDKNPLIATGYYRLLQKDKDGKFTYSAIVTIKSAPNKITLINTYPNPVTDKLYVLVGNDKMNSMATITLADMSGRVMSQFKKEIITGYSNIELRVAGLVKGLYVLKITMANGETLSARVEKR